MQYRTLGAAGLAVSNLALVTVYFGSETTEDDAFAVLDAFSEPGGKLIDTSGVYVDSMVGKRPFVASTISLDCASVAVSLGSVVADGHWFCRTGAATTPAWAR
jgi:hypothetical protein